jgi:hypothetical protein
VRYSVGIEDVPDLMADLDQALKGCEKNLLSMPFVERRPMAAA